MSLQKDRFMTKQPMIGIASSQKHHHDMY